jgi:quinolinate synthase
MEQKDIRQMLDEKGFIDEPVSTELKLVEEINRLKKEKNAVILSHYYVESDLQDIADYVGDSLGLAQEAAKTEAGMIVFVGVYGRNSQNYQPIQESDSARSESWLLVGRFGTCR